MGVSEEPLSIGNAIPLMVPRQEESHCACNVRSLLQVLCHVSVICVCGEHGQGRSREDMDMSGAKKCGRLCRLSPPEVTLSLQVLQRTQTLGHGQPSLIVMFLHVARCVVNLLRWQSCLEWRPRVYLLWQGIFEGELLHRHALSWLH
jgi:hypothetical protein